MALPYLFLVQVGGSRGRATAVTNEGMPSSSTLYTACFSIFSGLLTGDDMI